MKKEGRIKYVNVLISVLAIILVIIAFFLIVRLFLIVNFTNSLNPTGNVIQPSQQVQSPPASSSVDAVAAANGMRVLMPGEVAVFSSSENAAQDGVVSVIDLDGKKIEFTDGKAQHSVIGSVDGLSVLVKEGDNVEIINLNAGENEIDSLLSSSEIVPVIVSLNLPFDRFYETKQSAENVKDKEDKFNNAKAAIATSFSGKQKAKIKQDLLIIGAVSADIDADTYSSLKKNPNVKKISYDRPVKVVLDTSVSQINADDVWNFLDENGMPMTGWGKKIAIIDTGVDYTHSDLGGCFGSGCKVIGGYDFINNDNDPMDDHGHGTHVAATAAGSGLLKGVAPDAKIYAYKVLSSGGSGSFSQVIAGINRATDPNNDGSSDDHVDVGSMSLGAQCGSYSTGCGPDDDVSLAVDKSTAVGVVWTIAAGNSGPSASTVGTPGTSRTAITVAAACKPSQVGTDSRCPKEIASFSSRGPVIWSSIDFKKPDISAPGVLICAARWDSSFSTAPTCFDNNHVRISGTSMATPHMAGAAALVRQAYPTYSPEQVKTLLKSTAKPFSALTYNDQGAGLVDVLAAIPQGTNFPSKVSPTIWQVSSEPTQKYSTSQQNFVVTPKDTSVSSLTVNFEMSIPGVTLTSDKSSLNVANLANDSFNVTLKVDNDIAKSGAYFGRIILREGRVMKGAAAIYLTINPTIEVSPNEIDYGIDPPSLSSWTSEERVITVRNKRLDSAQTIALSSSLPTGVILQAPSSVSVAAGSQQEISTRLYISDNSKVADKSYSNQIFVSNSLSNLIINTKFVKMYVLRVNYMEAETSYSLIFVTNRATTLVRSMPPRTKFSDFYVSSPGSYDVIVNYGYSASVPNYPLVIREDILVNKGLTNIDISRKNATLSVQSVPINETGSQIFLPVLNIRLFSGAFDSNGIRISGSYDYFSPFSSYYNIIADRGEYQPKSKLYFFGYRISGLSSNRIFTNTPSQLKSVKLFLDTDKQTGNITPLVYPGAVIMSSTYKRGLPVPVRQEAVLYATPQDILIFDHSDYNSNADISPKFSIEDISRRWVGWFYYDGRSGLLPPMENNQLFTGLGPSYWAAKIQNTALKINIKPYLPSDARYCQKNLLLRQDYSYKSYPAFKYDILKNGVIVSTGNFPAFTSSGSWTSCTTPVTAINLASSGKYELRTAFNYSVKNIAKQGQVSSIFDTSLVDPNPPAFKRFYQYLEGARSEVYSPSGTNSFELEIDPVGGTLSSVQASYSQDGSTFIPVTVSSLGSNTYRFNLPSGLSFANLSVRISATDSSSNSLIYTFGAPASIPTPPKQYTLSVTVSGSGSVTSSPLGISCPKTCSANYNEGTTVALTPTASTGATFIGWSGACSGTGTCTVTMNSAKSVTASFTQAPSPPVAPSSLSGSAVSPHNISLSWRDNSNNEDGFKIERALAGKGKIIGTWSQIAITSANINNFLDTGLNAGTTYYYRVRAYNSYGNSAYSNTAKIYTQTCRWWQRLFGIPC